MPDSDQAPGEQTPRNGQPADSRLTKADLIPDEALRNSEGDSLDHKAIAEVVSRLASTVGTPANIALFGPWGSGKSSIYNMVRSGLDPEPGVLIVKYDAWKFGGSMLQRNFLSHVADKLDIPIGKVLGNLNNTTEVVRLRLGLFLVRNYKSLVGALLIAIIIAVVYVTGLAGLAQIGKTSWKDEALKLVPTGVTVFGLITAALLLSNQTLASAVEKRSRSPLQDADQFSGAFKDLMRQVRSKYKGQANSIRLVVFVDELDRCSPKDVVETLVSLKTFLDHEDCVFVVAADRDVLREALNEAPQAKPVRENEPYYSTAGAFIDKIFQHQISLPPVRPEALTDFAIRLANAQQGLWKSLRDTDARAYEDVVFALVPAHVRSPRRVKILMNNFTTTYRVIQARMLERQPDPAEVAVLTVLQTEFPALIEDLIEEPRLIEALVDRDQLGEMKPSEKLVNLVRAYDPRPPDGRPTSTPDERDDERSPAGPLLADDETSDEAAAQARLKLNQQLDGYLAYIDGAGIKFPTLDLIYLQDAAHVQGLTDPKLRQLVDVAHAYAVSGVLSDFQEATTGDRRAAIQFFAKKANTTFGPARANLVELACRLTETLDISDIQSIAPSIAPTVLGEVRSGRWRNRATPGALLLGLLDEQSDPLSKLGDNANPVALVEHGVFERIMPTLAVLEARRAYLIHQLLEEAYQSHAEPLHHAIATLNTDAVERLWDDVKAGITRTITNLPAEAPPPATGQATLAASATQDDEVEETIPDLAPERYAQLMTAFAERTSPAETAATDALIYGIKAPQAIYNHVYDHLDALVGKVVVEPRSKNDLALTGLAHGAAGNDYHWTPLLNDGAIDRTKLNDAAQRLIDDLAHVESIRDHNDLDAAFSAVALRLDEAEAEALAARLQARLAGLAYVDTEDTDGLRRKTAYALLISLSRVLPLEPIDAVRLADINHGLNSTDDIETIMGTLIEQIGLLSPAAAKELDSQLARKTTRSNYINRQRLRVRARRVADKPSLPAGAFADQLDDEAPSTALVDEWLDSNPPIRAVEALLEKANPTRQRIGTYAQHRSTAERSRLWIALFRANFHEIHLRAVGTHGVDETAVQHLADQIVEADLDRQKSLVNTLLTADASASPRARRAISDLVVKMLAGGRAGTGQSAASLIIAAGGAGTGKTRPVRAAFDTFTADHPKAINKGDVQRLWELRLVTKRKKNPISAFLGW